MLCIHGNLKYFNIILDLPRELPFEIRRKSRNCIIKLSDIEATAFMTTWYVRRIGRILIPLKHSV